MERRLLKAIMRPAMIAVWVLGLTLALTPGIVDWRSDGWIYVKLATVFALTWYHHWLLARWKDFDAGPQHADRPALPGDERAADAGARRHRDHGGGPAVLRRDQGI